MKSIRLLLLVFISLNAFAQQEPNLARYKTTDEKLKVWLQYTAQLLDKEDYPKLIKAADKGILIAKNQNAYKSRFYLQKGLAYEFSNNQYQNALVNYENAWKYARKARHLKKETTVLIRFDYAYY